jgi:hypothetical protein
MAHVNVSEIVGEHTKKDTRKTSKTFIEGHEEVALISYKNIRWDDTKERRGRAEEKR